MTYEEALNQNIKLSPIQARNDLERYLLREEKPIPKAVAMGMEALEKQIPKKTTDRQYVPNGTLIYGHCPNCDWFTKNFFNYCRKCGQALDWSDTE